MPTYDMSCLPCCGDDVSSFSSTVCPGECTYEWDGAAWLDISDGVCAENPECVVPCPDELELGIRDGNFVGELYIIGPQCGAGQSRFE